MCLLRYRESEPDTEWIELPIIHQVAKHIQIHNLSAGKGYELQVIVREEERMEEAQKIGKDFNSN